MKELLIYLISISSFILGGNQCETGINGYIEISDKNEIHICEVINRPRIEIALHEIAHIYWYKLKEEDKIQWINLYNESIIKSGTLKNRGFVTLYATTDYEEDFAETFQYLYLKGKETKKSLFIKNLILK